MAYQDHLIAVPAARNTVESCWMCGIRLPTDRLIADGGSACPDVRWYCQDSRACTERWTSRAAGSVAARPDGTAPAAAPLPAPLPSRAAGRTMPPWHSAGSQPETLAGPGTFAR